MVGELTWLFLMGTQKVKKNNKRAIPTSITQKPNISNT